MGHKQAIKSKKIKSDSAIIMNLLLLAGNSQSNKEWIEQVRDTLTPHFLKTYIHYYKHWKTGDELIDLNYELEEVIRTLGDLKEFAHHYFQRRLKNTE